MKYTILVKGNRQTAGEAIVEHFDGLQGAMFNEAHGSVTVTVLTKVDNRDALQEWYEQNPFPPYPQGALLHYTVQPPVKV